MLGLSQAILSLLLFCGIAAAEELPRIVANDNQVAGGMLAEGVLRIRLEVREGLWYPEAENGRSVAVQAFAEERRGPQIPGPMLRVPQGTRIMASVRNRLREGTATLHGLHSRPTEKPEPVEIPAGELREVSFRADVPGTYYYWASTSGAALDKRAGADVHLSGALIVVAPGAPKDDRVFVIGEWRRDTNANEPGVGAEGGLMLSVNGKSWPYTERLTHKTGESVRWRWINTTIGPHPMHLHGSYYRVDSVGDGNIDTIYAADDRRQVVTEVMDSGGTMATTWVPERPGRWLFHCHILAHMSPDQSIWRFGSENHSHDADSELGHASGMKGLVIGITVIPGAEAIAEDVKPRAARQIRLLVRERPANWTAPRAHVFQLQEGESEPPLERATVPGPVLFLNRGEPTDITVVNTLDGDTAVHWHGIEIESYYDGVPGWSGQSAQITPPITPGGSFVAKMTPPRAGTFIYHTHWHDELQLSTGLYGALIVTDPSKPFDPERERIFVISRGGPDPVSPVLLNGAAQPLPITMRTGINYRFRLINITPNNASVWVSLRDGRTGGALANWRAIAKDGADLPAAQAVVKPADQRVAVGETFDFEYQRHEAGEATLEVYLPVRHVALTQTLLFEGQR